MPQNPEGQGFSPAKKDRAEGATALPKAGVKPEGRNDPLLLLLLLLSLLLSLLLQLLLQLPLPQGPKARHITA